MRRSALIRVVLALGWLLPPVQPANADVILIVDTAADVIANDGACSLREAIVAANNNGNYFGCIGSGGGFDLIEFSVGAGTPVIGVVQRPARHHRPGRDQRRPKPGGTEEGLWPFLLRPAGHRVGRVRQRRSAISLSRRCRGHQPHEHQQRHHCRQLHRDECRGHRERGAQRAGNIAVRLHGPDRRHQRGVGGWAVHGRLQPDCRQLRLGRNRTAHRIERHHPGQLHRRKRGRDRGHHLQRRDRRARFTTTSASSSRTPSPPSAERPPGPGILSPTITTASNSRSRRFLQRGQRHPGEPDRHAMLPARRQYRTARASRSAWATRATR